MSVQQRAVLPERQAFVGMTDRMAEVKRLTDTMFFRVFLDNAFFHGDRLGHHLIQESIIDLRIKIEQHHGRINIHRTDKRMLDHLCIAGQQVITVQRTQELTIDKNAFGRIERTDFILQAVEVDSGLPSHRGIDRSHQGCRDIDGTQTPFKGCAGKTSHIGNHAAS